ncbi:hypothetical protein N2603_23370 [Bradyrhizobium huanghuaihaiense]|uniref:hypothetical protein n=1 Tax=Bradyrhizobium huanghuaihaiense TaxID=990078 RepID=UPI0021A9925A|nr:hypothetical protein [Bradyrhizobium sp. CB3035]UWU73047.1 hypothetical protein N2603_23370 [Bradyrhizobium sp. CB3035]
MAVPKTSIANLEAKAQETQSELAAAEAAFANAVQSMEAPPIELSDDQIGDLVDIKNIAEIRLVKARAAHRRADHALTEAKAAAAEKERKDNLARVHSMGSAAQEQMQRAIAGATKELRKAMRMMAEAEIAREVLNQQLPEGERISSFEIAVLSAPTVPRREISRKRELLWVHPSGRPYDEEIARRIRDNGDGTASLSTQGGPYTTATTTHITKRQYFDVITFADWIPSRGDSSLAQVLSLPGLKGGPRGWTPMRYVSPQGVLSELDRVEAYTSNDPEPDIRTELEMVSPVFDDVESLKTWEAAQRSKQPAEKAA